MSPYLHVQLIINGVATGFVYALLAIGFTLIWRSVAVSNFAQGDFAAVGMFSALVFYEALHWPLPLAIVGGITFTALVSVLIERFAFRPLLSAHPMIRVMATLGVSIIIENTLQIVFGPMPRRFPTFFGHNGPQLGPIVIDPQYVGTALTSLLFILILHSWFQRTMTGKALRAIAENREVASLMGINLKRLIPLAYAISAALGATAGVMIAPLVFVTTEIDFNLLIKTLIAALIGGFGSYPGALLGGLLVGVIDNICSFYISAQFRDALLFSILIFLMMVKPTGLLGKSLREI